MQGISTILKNGVIVLEGRANVIDLYTFHEDISQSMTSHHNTSLGYTKGCQHYVVLTFSLVFLVVTWLLLRLLHLVDFCTLLEYLVVIKEEIKC